MIDNAAQSNTFIQNFNQIIMHVKKIGGINQSRNYLVSGKNKK
jgi:hypothetical protein